MIYVSQPRLPQFIGAEFHSSVYLLTGQKVVVAVKALTCALATTSQLSMWPAVGLGTSQIDTPRRKLWYSESAPCVIVLADQNPASKTATMTIGIRYAHDLPDCGLVAVLGAGSKRPSKRIAVGGPASLNGDVSPSSMI